MPIERLVIFGGGIGGWLAASLLARALPDAAVTVAEMPGPDQSLGIATTVETLLPADRVILFGAGFDEDALIGATGGSFALGHALTGWRSDREAAFIPFGDIGAPMGPTAFHQLVARARDDGVPVNLANYALAALCAQTGRFARPAVDDASVQATLDYGLHVDTAAFAQWLRNDALGRGVVTATDPELANADLIVDASGPASALRGPFESWRTYFPCDRAASALRPTPDPPQPFTHIDAHGAGWQAFLPVRGAIGETFVYAKAALPDGPTGQPFESGRQEAAWRGNIVAIGGAAAVIDPVAGTQLHMAMHDIARLIALLPNSRDCAAEAREYNRQWREKTGCVFDYALLHTVKRAGNMASAPLPDRLGYRIALFEACGRVAVYDGESFEASQWVAAFDAFGIRARRHDALAQGMTLDSIEAHFARIREAMLRAVAAMPPHAAYLEHIVR